MADKTFGHQFDDAGTIFSGRPVSPVPTFNVAEAMGMSGGSGMLVNSLMQGLVPQLFGSPSSQFGQFMPHTNLYDQFRQRADFDMQQESIRHASQLDKKTYAKTFKTIANLAGTPFGARESQAADTLSDDLATIMPMLVMAAPDLVDRMHGTKGSAAVMAMRMSSGSRYMTDPLTGSLGMSKESVKAMHQNVYEDLFGEKADLGKMKGVTAGQAGAMFDEMSRRGIMGSGQRTLAEIMGPNNKMSKDEFVNQPDFMEKVHKFESSRISEKIKGMTGAISAVKDIFGENGQPDAPMNELFNALQKMTQNNIANMNPAQAEKMVRGASAVAKMTGMTLEGMMANIAGTGQVTDRFGLSRSFAPRLASSSALYAQAYGSVMGGVEGFDIMGKEEALGVKRQLMAGAASSQQANYMAALVRGADAKLLRANDPEISQYIRDLKAGKATPKTPEELMAMANRAGMSGNTFARLASQTTTNQGVIAAHSLDTNVAAAQRKEIEGVTARTFETELSAEGITPLDSQKASKAIASRLINMTATESQQYAKGDLSFLKGSVDKELGPGMFGKLKHTFEMARGSLDTLANSANYRNSFNMLSVNNSGVAAEAEAQKNLSEERARMAAALAGLNRSTPLQRLANVLIEGTGNDDFSTTASKFFGAISNDKIKQMAQEGGVMLDKGRALSGRKNIMQDAQFLTSKSNTPENLAEVKKIQEVYGLNPAAMPDIRGKSNDEVVRILGMSKSSAQRKIIEDLDMLFRNNNVDVIESNVTDKVRDSVKSAISKKSENAGALTTSLAESLLGDEGVRRMVSNKKVQDMHDILRGSGVAMSALSEAKATDAGRAAAAKNTSALDIQARTAENLRVSKIKQDELDKLATAAGGTVASLVDNISVIDVTGVKEGLLHSKAESHIHPFDAAVAAMKGLPADATKEQKDLAESNLNSAKAKIVALSQEYGFNPDSIIDPKKFLAGNKLAIEQRKQAHERLLQRDELSTELQKLVSAAGAFPGASVKDVLGGLSDDVAKTLGVSAESKIDELNNFTEKGVSALTSEQRDKLIVELRRNENIRSEPGTALDTLLSSFNSTPGKALEGPNADVVKELNSLSSSGKAKLASGIQSLEKLTMSEKDGGSGARWPEIMKELSGEGSNLSEAIKKQINQIDPEVRKGIYSNDWKGPINTLNKAAKDELESKKKEAATYVKLADGTTFAGSLSLESGDMVFSTKNKA